MRVSIAVLTGEAMKVKTINFATGKVEVEEIEDAREFIERKRKERKKEDPVVHGIVREGK
jgi:hypothetical protein